MIRIGHAQLEAPYGKFESNLERMVATLERADRERVAIVSLPECYLTGYPDVGELARKNAFAVQSPEMARVISATARFAATCIVGFNETRGPDLYNTCAVLSKGHLLGTYSKCMAYQSFHKRGKEFPVFEHAGVKFGVIVCADGGYPEPTRILALKGAQIVFAPHFNYIGKEALIDHFQHVRSDHIARAVEAGVYFVRGNNVCLGKAEEITRYDGVGYGDSYILDPFGETVVRSRRGKEDFIFADVDPTWPATLARRGRSRQSAQIFGQLLLDAANEKPPEKA